MCYSIIQFSSTLLYKENHLHGRSYASGITRVTVLQPALQTAASNTTVKR